MVTRVTKQEFFAEAEKRFGPDAMDWQFVCPSCGHIATPKDWREAKAPEGAVAFSCVGRYLPAGSKVGEMWGNVKPCNYAGGGLFAINPMIVTDENGSEHNMFALAGEPFPVFDPA